VPLIASLDEVGMALCKHRPPTFSPGARLG
jgi:hypothetical protein